MAIAVNTSEMIASNMIDPAYAYCRTPRNVALQQKNAKKKLIKNPIIENTFFMPKISFPYSSNHPFEITAAAAVTIADIAITAKENGIFNIPQMGYRIGFKK